MKIKSIDFSPTHIDQRVQLGDVRILLSNARLIICNNVRADQFGDWLNSGFDHTQVPWAMRNEWRALLRTMADVLLDDEEFEEEQLLLDGEEPEEELDEEPVLTLDPLGEVTGVSSPGCGRIRDDDALGKITGIPTVGFEVPNMDLLAEYDTAKSQSLDLSLLADFLVDID